MNRYVEACHSGFGCCNLGLVEWLYPTVCGRPASSDCRGRTSLGGEPHAVSRTQPLGDGPGIISDSGTGDPVAHPLILDCRFPWEHLVAGPLS